MGGVAGTRERIIDVGVAALFAIGAGFPALMLLPDWGMNALPVAVVLALAAFALSFKVLGLVGGRAAPAVQFDLAPMPQFPAVDALDLSLDDRLEPALADRPAGGEDEALELDDELPAIGPGSRVVQLFGGPATATAGELAVRIERHLARRDGQSGAAPPPAHPVVDSSSELFDALSALRQSLR